MTFSKDSVADLCERSRGHGPTLLFALDQMGDVLKVGVAAAGVGEGVAAPTVTGQVTVIGHFWDPFTAQQTIKHHSTLLKE